MRKIIAIFVFVFLLAASLTFVNADSRNYEDINKIQLNYNFDNIVVDELELSGITFSSLEFSNTGSYGDPGEPVIPVKGAYILLPYGQEYKEIQVNINEEKVISTKYQIQPGQEPYPFSSPDIPEFIPPKEEIYNSEEQFPGKTYDIVSTQFFRGFQIIVLRLYPVQYTPKLNQINVAKSIQVNVLTDFIQESDKENIYKNYRAYDEDFEEVIKKVDNPEIIESYPKELGVSPLEDYDYVIITSENLKNYNGEYNFQAFRDKRIDEGMTSTIVTKEDILQDYSGADDQAKIREFIIDAYNNWGTEFVLIGGDVDIIPIRYLSAQGTNIPTDLYYECLDGAGPSGTNGDYFAEVYVGRASVGNDDEVSNFVKKTISYIDTKDPYTKKALWVGEYLGFGGQAQYGAWMKDQNIGYCNADGYVTSGLPEGGDDGYIVDRLYERDMSWSKNTIMGKINDNVHLINHLGHGDVDYAMKLYNSDISHLTNNKYLFAYSQTCLAGALDQGDCAAEYFTVKTDHGAFAVIMNARYGWGQHDSTDGPSNRYDREFWDAIYNEEIVRIGHANQDSKEDNYYRINEQCMLWIYYELNLFGDPAITFKGVGPELDYSPKSHDFGNVEKGSIISTTFDIWNDGVEVMDYSFSCIEPGVTINPINGNSEGEIDTITVTIDTNILGNGIHDIEVKIVSDGGDGTFLIKVIVGPVLSYSPISYDFGAFEQGESGSTTFEIWNSAIQTLEYSLSTSSSFVTINPQTGSSTGEHDTITVTVDTTGLANGSYNDEIIIITNEKEGKFKLKFGVGSVLAYSPESYDFGMININEIKSLRIKVWNDGLNTLEYSFLEDCDWLEINPVSGSSSGEQDIIDIQVDTSGLGIAKYSYDIIIESNGGNGIFTVDMDVVALFESKLSDGELMFERVIFNNNIEWAYNSLHEYQYGQFPIYDDSISVGQSIFEESPKNNLFSNIFLGDRRGDITLYQLAIHRGFLNFDTSNIPGDVAITDAYIGIYGLEGPINQKEEFEIIIQNGQPDYPHEPLHLRDFYHQHYSGNGGSIDVNDFIVNEYNLINLNNLGISWINRSGTTKFCLRSSRDIDILPPPVDANGVYQTIKFASAENLENMRPYLIVKYGSPPDDPHNPAPYNGETDVKKYTALAVDVADPNNEDMDVNFVLNKEEVGTVENVPSGTRVSLDVSDYLEYNTTYNWFVSVTDVTGLKTRSKVWNFTTMEEPVGPVNDPPNVPIDPEPGNGEIDVNINPYMSVLVTDPDNEFLNVTFYDALDDSVIDIKNNVANNSRASAIWSDLSYNTSYSWYAVVDDGEYFIESSIYSFTTKEKPVGPVNHPPNTPITPDPVNGETGLEISPIISVLVTDPDGDIMNVTFYNASSSLIIGKATDIANNSRASIAWEDLSYNTSYSWYAVVDDGEYYRESETFNFKTKEKTVEKVIVEITKPLENNFYFLNSHLKESIFTLILGGIDIQVNVSVLEDNDVENISFYLDDSEAYSTKFDSSVDKYNWSWTDKAIGFYTIEVAAVNDLGEKIKSDSVDVFIFSLGLIKL